MQAVGYTTNGGGGDEDDIVLPASVDLSRFNPSPRSSSSDTALTWTRDNSELEHYGKAYYATLTALRNLTSAGGVAAGTGRVASLLMSLPYDDERKPSQDGQLVASVVDRMLAH